LPDILYGREIWYLTLREERGLRVYGNRVSREICMSERDEVSFVLLTKYYLGDQIKKNEMGGACGTFRGEERFIKSCTREV
jgi:hypothetical protein